jgi:hypothetical protein
MGSRKTYVPQMAKTMHYLGKYILAHRVKLFESIDADDRITVEQKARAKKVLLDILDAHNIFWILNQPVYEDLKKLRKQ